jgi:hypothetical protein
MNLPEESDVNVLIYDMLGKEVFSRNLGQVYGQTNQFFTLYDLRAGSYIVDIVFPEGVVRKKLIVNH